MAEGARDAPADGMVPAGAAFAVAGRPAVAWRPTPAQAATSYLGRFMAAQGLQDYDALLARSVREPEWFWQAVVTDLGLEWYTPYERVLDLSAGVPFAQWFVGGRYNYVHNAVDRHARSARSDAAAIVWEGEDGAVRTLTYAELDAEVCRLANGLRALGIRKGDRVGIFMPMVPETAVATLAVSKLGAIYTPIFSGYGAAAVAARLADCDARLLITADGFPRRGNAVPMKETADEAVAQVSSVERVLVYRRLGREVPCTPGRDVWWDEAVADQPTTCATEQTAGDDPCMIIYTSGTTGRPKGALHVHHGFPLKATQDLAHCFDLGPGDRLFWLTDIGWMMGPWAIMGALTLGATLVAFEGTPDYPGPDRLWEIVERHHVTHLGISPTAVRGLMRYGVEPVQAHDLSTLRVLGSTGEPWNPEPWWWYFDHVGGGHCPIINYSGGTEVSGGIVGCTPVQAIKPCSFSGPVPGMAADVVDDAGQSVRGEVGELVIRAPWPGMTHGFWRDAERYLETYWSRFENVWVHGDWALVDEDGFWYILGRSDDTLKVAGKRVGPAEVESAAVAHAAVSEAAAIGVPDEVKGEAIVVFAVLVPGYTPSDALRAEVEEAVVHELGRALRPKAVRFVRDLPKTRNAKIMRRVIRAKYLGRTDLGDLTSLENPAAVEEIAHSR
jgi:acetyl-CoA synthetase